MTVEQFDKWLSENLYPALAGMVPELEGYTSMTPAVAKRYAKLCAGKPENPIICSIMSLSGFVYGFFFHSNGIISESGRIFIFQYFRDRFNCSFAF